MKTVMILLVLMIGLAAMAQAAWPWTDGDKPGGGADHAADLIWSPQLGGVIVICEWPWADGDKPGGSHSAQSRTAERVEPLGLQGPPLHLCDGNGIEPPKGKPAD